MDLESGAILLLDIHNHTTFSDGKYSPEDVIKAGIDTGLRVIGISDHYDPYLLKQSACLQPEELRDYSSYINNLKGKFPIELVLGLEVGTQSTGVSAPEGPYDYFIYSIHTVPGLPGLTRMEYPWKEYLTEAIEAVRLIKKPGFIGHLDFLRRHIPGSAPIGEPGLIDEFMKVIVRLDLGLELNTSGWNYEFNEPTPQRWIIERYLNLGGKYITIGSDSHWTPYVGQWNARARELLLDLGVKEVFYCKDFNYVPVELKQKTLSCTTNRV